MAQLQHWLVTCTTCDGLAEYHCNTCGDILCPRCREIHQRSRGTGHHSIVPYTERVEPGKLTGQCGDHPGNQLALWDQTCDKAVCTDCIASAEHKSHNFEKIAAKLDEQRKAIKYEFGTYSKLLKTWTEYLQQIQSNMKAYENDVDELGKEITRSADRVCEQVRSIEAALKKQLQEIKKSQRALIQDQEQILANGIEGIKRRIKEAEDKLRSEDVGVFLSYGEKIDKGNINTPPEVEVSPLPSFTPGALEIQSLEKMIGSFSFPKVKQDKTEAVRSSQKISQEASGNLGITGSPGKQSITAGLASNTKTLVPTATVISTIQTSKEDLPYLACTGSGQSWVRTDKNGIQLFDRQGISVKTITTKFNTEDMTITPQGSLLISDYYNAVIKSVTDKGEIQTLFRTKMKPWGICCLQNGDVVVAFGLNRRVIQYSRAGKVVREFDRSLFGFPRNVAQNKINNHIYVCNKSSVGLEVTGTILTFKDVTGRIVSEYTGSDASTFSPEDVCTDQAGLVIITELAYDRIHILDQDGRFLQYMMTKDQGLYRPYFIDTDSNGYAWVSEWEYQKTSQVKILKYTK